MLECKIVMFSTMKMEPLELLIIDGQEMMDNSLVEVSCSFLLGTAPSKAYLKVSFSTLPIIIHIKIKFPSAPKL